MTVMYTVLIFLTAVVVIGLCLTILIRSKKVGAAQEKQRHLDWLIKRAIDRGDVIEAVRLREEKIRVLEQNE